MSRGVLVIGGLLVAGAALALVLLLGRGSDSASPGNAKTQPADSTATSPQGPRPTLGPGDPTAQPGDQPGGTSGAVTPGNGPPPLATGSNAPVVTPRDQPRGTGAETPGQGAAPQGQDYAVGDVRVRDHRGGSNAPLDVPPNVHTPEGPRIDSTLTAALGRKVKLVMLECAKTASRDGRGTEPRVDGQIVIAVKTNQATIVSSVMQPHDVSAAAASAIKSCVEPKLVGVTAPAPNQADLDNYSINLSMKLP
jgi:hypothetical protein